MTTALVVYSAVFMRYSMAVTPANYLLFGRPSLCPGWHLTRHTDNSAGCHFVNECAQLAQGYRYINFWQCVSLPKYPRPAVGIAS